MHRVPTLGAFVGGQNPLEPAISCEVTGWLRCTAVVLIREEIPSIVGLDSKGQGMKLVTAVIKPFKLDDVREALSDIGQYARHHCHRSKVASVVQTNMVVIGVLPMWSTL